MTSLICSFVSCGFVMDCQRGRLLGHMCFTCLGTYVTIFVIGLSIDKTHFTCIWVDLGCVEILQETVFQDQMLKSSSLSKIQAEKVSVIKVLQLAR